MNDIKLKKALANLKYAEEEYRRIRKDYPEFPLVAQHTLKKAVMKLLNCLD